VLFDVVPLSIIKRVILLVVGKLSVLQRGGSTRRTTRQAPLDAKSVRHTLKSAPIQNYIVDSPAGDCYRGRILQRHRAESADVGIWDRCRGRHRSRTVALDVAGERRRAGAAVSDRDRRAVPYAGRNRPERRDRSLPGIGRSDVDVVGVDKDPIQRPDRIDRAAGLGKACPRYDLASAGKLRPRDRRRLERTARINRTDPARVRIDRAALGKGEGRDELDPCIGIGCARPGAGLDDINAVLRRRRLAFDEDTIARN